MPFLRKLGKYVSGTGRRRRGRRLYAIVLLLAGCQTYRPAPLPTAPDLRTAITVPATTFGVPGINPHPVDLSKGLDVETVMALAVADDPDLKAARAQAGVADAQALEAGLLPDPTLSAGLSRSSEFTGYDANLSEDLQALITRGARKAAAKASRREVNLDILWQEWQVAEKAQELVIQDRTDARLEALYQPDRELLEKIARSESTAYSRGDTTAADVADAAKAFADADANLRQIQLDRIQADHDLKALLGLRPDAALPLADAPFPALPLSEEAFSTALESVPRRRPDLLALQAGYQSQEEQLREAVLAQFPSISAGVDKARSAEEGISTVGFSVNLTLPVFDRNRGKIAIERATRTALHAAYVARLDQAVGEAGRLRDALAVMRRQSATFAAELPHLARSVAAAQREYDRGDLAGATLAALRSSYDDRIAAMLHLRGSIAQADAALRMVLALPISENEASQ